MKKYYEYCETSCDSLVCKLAEEDVAKAEKEFFLYMQCKGGIYDLDEYKSPSVKNFFKLFFGECEYDLYYGDCWYAPNRYICENKEVADRFMRLAKQLGYHDHHNQTFCDVEQKGEIVDVYYGDY